MKEKLSWLLTLLPLTIIVIVTDAYFRGSREAQTFMMVGGAILIFMSGGACVLIAQVVSAKINQAHFKDNAAENLMMMQTLKTQGQQLQNTQREIVVTEKLHNLIAKMDRPQQDQTTMIPAPIEYNESVFNGLD